MSSIAIATDPRGVTRVTLNRPARHNALDRAFIDELRQGIDSTVDRTRVLILAGAGDSFCAGADIDWMKAAATLDEAANRDDAQALSALLETLDRYPHPTIAQVHGAAIGGGAGLVACCDMAIASDDARFGFSEVRLGLLPATISPYVIAAIGARAARRRFLTGERFDAIDALRLRLVDDVCSADNLEYRIEERVEALLTGAPDAQIASKRLIADIAGRPIDDALRQELVDRLAGVRTGEEAREGMRAFLEKRDPTWR